MRMLKKIYFFVIFLISGFLINLTFQLDSHAFFCETDANGTKKDENCNAFFDVPFNYTDADGKYPFVDIVSTGEKIYGNITVNPDVHLTPGFQNKEPEENIDEADDEGWR